MDAAQKLGIESGILRDEVRRAAAARVESVPAKRGEERVSETERVLLRALTRPEGDRGRAAAVAAVAGNAGWFEGLAAAGVMEVLASGPVEGSPLDAAPDEASRTMLARVLGEENTDEVGDCRGEGGERAADAGAAGGGAAGAGAAGDAGGGGPAGGCGGGDAADAGEDGGG